MLGKFWHQPTFWAVSVCCWFTLLWWLSSRSLPPVGPTFDHADKLKHLVYFTAGSFCVARFLILNRPAWKAASITFACIAFALLVGASDEYHQTLTPGRSGNDLGDLLADTAGGLLGALLALRSRPQPTPVTPD
jgi:VanZ family protein